MGGFERLQGKKVLYLVPPRYRRAGESCKLIRIDDEPDWDRLVRKGAYASRDPSPPHFSGLWNGPINPFEIIHCPLCNRREFVMIEDRGVRCGLCNAGFEMKLHRSGEVRYTLEMDTFPTYGGYHGRYDRPARYYLDVGCQDFVPGWYGFLEKENAVYRYDRYPVTEKEWEELLELGM